jgi:hypothetical protein
MSDGPAGEKKGLYMIFYIYISIVEMAGYIYIICREKEELLVKEGTALGLEPSTAGFDTPPPEHADSTQSHGNNMDPDDGRTLLLGTYGIIIHL